MKFLAKIVFYFLVNLVALLAAAYLVPGFYVTQDPKSLFILTAVFTAINLVLKPILKLIFAPLIFITLGLFSLVINAIILKLLTIWSVDMSVTGIPALIYATILITAVNLILTFVAKSSFKE